MGIKTPVHSCFPVKTRLLSSAYFNSHAGKEQKEDKLGFEKTGDIRISLELAVGEAELGA